MIQTLPASVSRVAYYTQSSYYQESERRDYALMLARTDAGKDACRVL